MKELIVVHGEARQVVLRALREEGYNLVARCDAPEVRCAGAERRSPRCAAGWAVDILVTGHAASGESTGLYRYVINAVERPLIEMALRKTGGNQVRAARLLGINRNTFRAKMRKLRISTPVGYSLQQ